MEPIKKEAIPKEIDDNLKLWKWSARLLCGVQVFLGVLGLTASVVVTAFIGETGETVTPWIRACSIIAPICYGTLTAFAINDRIDERRKAWNRLDDGRMRYWYIDNESKNMDRLLDANSQAKQMIGGILFTEPKGK
jgi:hypothetical protein